MARLGWSPISWVFIVCLLCSYQARALTFLTEENPPFNYTADKKTTGVATNVVLEIARRAGEQSDIRMSDWDAAYRSAQVDNNTCLFSTARLENRENLFQWVGPIAVNRWALFAREDFNRKLATLKDLHSLKIGGVVLDAKVDYLRTKGVTTYRDANRDEENPSRLYLKPQDPNYIDLWVTGYFSASELAKKAKVGPVKPVFVLQEIPLYLACSPRTPKATIQKLSAALEAMRKDGTYKRLESELEKVATTK
jgi:polar amino acid transport system substrate-binding protein